ncbi:MAG: TonB-dependent receptor [Pseudomonadota bacterium]
MSSISDKARAGLFGVGLVFAAAPFAEAAVIEGRVADASGEVSLDGAVVTLTETGQSTTTGRNGRFYFGDVPAGEYTVSVDYLGAEEMSQTIVVTEDEIADLTFTLGEDVIVMDNVLVTGQRGAFFSARNQERAADGIIEVLSADAVGSLPDQNVAESVRRASGVSVANDQGEGRFVIIRGLDPELNATAINGVRITAPEGDARAVALDVIDADALESIVITKTFTPDQDGDGIGGSIDIRTISGLDREGPYVRAKLEGIYSDVTEQVGGKGSLTASNQFLDGRLGLAGSATYNLRRFGSENREVDGGFILDEPLFYPEELELRDYIIERERISASANLDFRLTNNTDLYLRGVYNRFEDQEIRSRVEIKLDDATFEEAVGTTAVFSPVDDALEFDRQTRDRGETQTIYSIQAGGESRFGATVFDYSAAFTHAEEEEPNATESVFRFEVEGGDGRDDFRFGLDVADLTAPLIDFSQTDPAYLDPSEYEFDEFERTNGFTEDEELALTFNVRHDTDILGAPGFWKSGVKVRLRDKRRDVENEIFDGFDGEDLFLTPFAREREFPLEVLGPVAGLSFQEFFTANEGLFELNETDTALTSFEEDYDATENIYAAYVMWQADLNERLRATIGVRGEFTDFVADGFFVQETDGSVSVGGADVAEDAVILANRERNSYVDFLPAFILRYEPNDIMVMRAAYSRTLARPTIGQAVPSAILEIEDGEIQGEVGNPDLDRQLSDNFDLSVDFYPSDSFVLSAGFFYKLFTDFIGDTVVRDTNLFGVDFDEAAIAVNLDGGEAFGVEVSAQKVFTELPDPFDGFLAGANITFLGGNAELDGRRIPLPNLSEAVGSVVVGYDKYGLDLRAALSYRDERLQELNTGGDGIDRFVDEHLQLDITAKYELTDRLELTAEAQNVTNEPFRAFLQLPNGERALSQFEEYGVTYRLGLRYTY